VRKIAKEENQGPKAWQLTALVIGAAQLIVELFQLVYRWYAGRASASSMHQQQVRCEAYQQTIYLPVRAGFSGSVPITGTVV